MIEYSPVPHTDILAICACVVICAAARELKIARDIQIGARVIGKSNSCQIRAQERA